MVNLYCAKYLLRKIFFLNFENTLTTSAIASLTQMFHDKSLDRCFMINVLTNLFGMPLTFIATKDICIRVIRMATIGIKSSYITKLVHLYTAEDKYTTYEIENTQTYERANRMAKYFTNSGAQIFFLLRNEDYFISSLILP